MNKAVTTITGAILATCFAAAPASAKLKIGVVNMQRAITESKDGKAAERKLKQRKSKLEAELNRKLKEFYAEEAKLRKAWSILKDDERRKRAADSQRKFQALQKRYVSAERELMKRKTKVMMSITKKLTKVIQKIAQRQKYDYIFANAAVLWAPRHVDLTNEVIRQYNR